MPVRPSDLAARIEGRNTLSHLQHGNAAQRLFGGALAILMAVVVIWQLLDFSHAT